jgi:hypothetical protein
MASLGIVEHVGEKRLGLFRTVRYPEKDHTPEAALLKKIEAALGGALPKAEAPDARRTDAEASALRAPDAEAPDATMTAEPSDAGTIAEAPEAQTTDAAKRDAKAPEAKPVVKAPDARTTALIALLQAAGLFGKLFPAAADRIRASELAKDYWPARAVEDELRMIRLAEEEAATL